MILLNGMIDTYQYDELNIEEKIRLNVKYNTVFKGEAIGAGKPVHIKRVTKTDDAFDHKFQTLQNEINLGDDSRYFISCIELIEDKKNYYLVRDYVDGLDLYSILKNKSYFKKNKKLTKQKIALSLCDAVNACHARNVVHCDIRPANFILENYLEINKENFEPIIKLIDFSLSFSSTAPLKATHPFSMVYSAPEQVLNKPKLITKHSDQYQLAITIYELLAEEKAFGGSNRTELKGLMISNLLNERKFVNQHDLEILKKASSKPTFLKPLEYYQNAEIEHAISESIKLRYDSILEFKENLILALKKDTLNNKTSFLEGVKSFFK